jgi:N-carbamoylputrescine amidase
VANPWENFLTTRALENGVFLAACNHVGKEGDWVMSGKSMVIDPLGAIMTQTSGADEEVLCVDVEREAVVKARQRFHFSRDRRPDAYGAIAHPMEELLR